MDCLIDFQNLPVYFPPSSLGTVLNIFWCRFNFSSLFKQPPPLLQQKRYPLQLDNLRRYTHFQ